MVLDIGLGSGAYGLGVGGLGLKVVIQGLTHCCTGPEAFTCACH